MAEIIAITASVAGIMQLAQYGLKVADTLQRFSGQLGSTSQDVKRFAAQVRSFSQIIGLAEVSLLDHCASYSESHVLDYIIKHKILDGLSGESEIVRDRLSDVRHRVSSMNSKVRLLSIFKWMLYRESILELAGEMESVKSSVGLVLAIVQLEVSTLVVRKAATDSQTIERQQRKM